MPDDTNDLDAKLADVPRQYDAISADLARPEITQDPAQLRRLGQEQARREPVVQTYRWLLVTREQLAGARQLRDAESDEELRALARDEIARLEGDERRLTEELKVQLRPRDPNDDRNVILEVRAGAGGEEAALFANELLRMYLRWAAEHRFATDLMSAHETGIGGMKE